MARPPRVERRTEQRWYGWQTLVSDGAALASLVASGLAFNGDAESLGALMAFSSLGGYVVGGPIVHATQGNWGRAAGSLGLRVGTPLMFGGIGMGLENCSSEEMFCGLSGLLLGGVVGIATAVAVDSAVLARDTVEIKPSYSPVASANKEGGWLGVAGTF